MKANIDGSGADLRYLDAHSVRCSAGSLSDFRVCTEDAEQLGTVDGVLISPAARRLFYLVIHAPGVLAKRYYLLRVDEGAVVRSERKTLHIPARRDELDLERFVPSSVPDLSDEDLLQAVVAQGVA